jgi:hypothetical protein
MGVMCVVLERDMPVVGHRVEDAVEPECVLIAEFDMFDIVDGDDIELP